MSDREAFEKHFTVPDDAIYNVELNQYCWRTHPTSAHPFDSTYEGWCAGWCESRREIERLIQCLQGANEQAKHFEREWYLRGDDIEKLLSIKPHISEGIFGWGLRNDDGNHLSMDDTNEIAEYIMKQAAQAAQAQAQAQQPVVPEGITGKQWSAMRDSFQFYAIKFRDADNSEIASACADAAPHGIYKAMLSAGNGGGRGPV